MKFLFVATVFVLSSGCHAMTLPTDVPASSGDSRPFVFHTGQAILGKNQEITALKTLNNDPTFDSATPSKFVCDHGGDDSYFVRSSVIGVADGVGSSTDAGLYSRRLMELTAEEFENANTEVDLPNILERANQKATAENKFSQASTTLVLAAIENKNMKFLNLGDSGIMVIRNGQIIYRSSDLDFYPGVPHRFNYNFPLQLDTTGNAIAKAVVGSLQIEEDDLVIMASDGIFDNIFDNALMDFVYNLIEEENVDEPELLAKAILEEARKTAQDSTKTTPFELKAKRHECSHTGGKMDDMVCVVGKVKVAMEPTEKS